MIYTWCSMDVHLSIQVLTMFPMLRNCSVLTSIVSKTNKQRFLIGRLFYLVLLSFLRHPFLNLRWFYLVVLGLGALLSCPLKEALYKCL